MPNPLPSIVREPDPNLLLLIVVGSHLQAELHDRPLAYSLMQTIQTWQQENGCEAELAPLICTDVWYLNDAGLLARPAVILGRPEVNAASAFFTRRLPVAFVMDGAFQVQMDLDGIDPQACVWGTSAVHTASAVNTFVSRFADRFLRCAHNLPAEAV